MMKRRNIFSFLSGILMPLAVMGILLCFLTGLADISSGYSQEDKQQLEDALHRAAMACYSIEGFYPPDLAYLEERYGIQINRQKYVVSYVPIADNLMPDITILEK